MLNYLHLTSTLARIRLDGLDNFLQITQEAIDREKKNLDEWYKEAQQQVGTAEALADLEDYASDKWHRIDVQFRDTAHSALCVAIYSLLEAHLKRICDLAPHITTPTPQLALDDIAGQGIQRHLKYIDKVMRLKIDKGSTAWGHLNFLRQIRNAMVHNDGVVGNEKLRDYCKTNDNFFELGLANDLRIKKEYFPFVLKNVREWLESFYGLNGVTVHLA